MPKISRKEYEVLKAWSSKWKWIVRTARGAIKTFLVKPRKDSGEWLSNGKGNFGIYTTYSDLFQFIQWEDEGPYNIQELIEEYEKYQNTAESYSNNLARLSKHWFNAVHIGEESIRENQKRQFEEEGEETEVKTLESIREEIWEEMVQLEPDRKNQWSDIRYQTLREILQKLGHVNQETLSPEWIGENKQQGMISSGIFGDRGRYSEYIPVNKVQNLLVPKQEEITEEQAWEVISKSTGAETIQNNIDYLEANGYVVSEKDEEQSEIVAGVVLDYMKAQKRFNEVMAMEVEEDKQ